MMRNWHLDRVSRIEETHHSRQMAITEVTTDLVASIDIDGFFIHLNKAGYELLELDPGTDITRLRLAGFYRRECADNFINTETPKAVMYGATHSEIELKTARGACIPSSQVLIAHKDALGNVECFSVILRDIRSIKEAEKERRVLAEQLHQSNKMETMGRLAGGVAHDFNNFITVIMGYAELGLLNTASNVSCQTELDIILDSARKAARLSNQLLDFSSKQMIEPQVLNLNEVLQNSSQLVESLMGEEITIKISTDYALWPIKIDRSQLEQIILNLSVNARDALGIHGTYSLKTENMILSTRDANKLGLPRGGDYVRFTISDTGCGIDERIIEQIFDPFFTTKEKGKGTGLGLSAVYGAVKQNGGHIKVTSAPGEGATFDIFFPRADSNPESIHTGENGDDEEKFMAGTETILLVEDNGEVRKLLSTILSELGYSVLEAENGMSALAVLDREINSIDLVISDVIMPKMNGMELYRELQKADIPVKVMLMSGHTDQVISLQELSKNNIPLLNKPFPTRKFAEAVRNVLDNPGELRRDE